MLHRPSVFGVQMQNKSLYKQKLLGCPINLCADYFNFAIFKRLNTHASKCSQLLATMCPLETQATVFLFGSFKPHYLSLFLFFFP